MSSKPDATLNQRRFSHRLRLIRVYWVAAQIGLSYLWLKIGGIVFGERWKQRRRGKVHFRSAQKIEAVIIVVKGLFVKIGQLLSILTQVLPPEFRKGLKGVQDQIPARSIEDVYARIETSFGAKPEVLFANFDPIPVASASLAQVHRATLKDDRQVAVKVQHYDIEAMAEIDLRNFRRLLKLVGFFFRLKGLDHAYLQVRAMILEELDFRKEAKNLTAISQNFRDNQHIHFPQVVPAFSSERVLTTTFEEGVKITEFFDTERNGVSRAVIAKRLADAYLQMLLNHGLFHADPHPGNLLVKPDGTIVFLDFGAIGELDPTMKHGIPEFLKGVIEQDPSQIQKSLGDMGFLQADSESEALNQVIEYLQQRFMGQQGLDQWQINTLHFDLNTKLEIMADMKQLNLSTRAMMATIQVPKAWVILHRTLVLLLGLVSDLDPNLKPIPLIRPYLKGILIQEKQDILARVLDIIKRHVQDVFSMPKRFRQTMERIEQGELKVQVSGYNHRTRLLYALGHQILFTMFSIASGFLAYFAWQANHPSLFGYAWKGSVFFAICLVVSILRARRWYS